MEELRQISNLANVKVKNVTRILFQVGVSLVGMSTLLILFQPNSNAAIVFGSIILIIGLLILLFALYQYNRFAKENPAYLRSESYQLKSEAMMKIGSSENWHKKSSEHLIEIVAERKELKAGDLEERLSKSKKRGKQSE